MKKTLLIILLFFIPLGICAEDIGEKNKDLDKNSLKYKWSLIKSLENTGAKEDVIDEIQSLKAEIVSDMAGYSDHDEFIKDNFYEIVSEPLKNYEIWRRALVVAENSFIRSVADDENLSMDIRNWAYLQISDDISRLDEIYSYYKDKNDELSKKYAEKQALYTLFNKSDSYGEFKINLGYFKFIDAEKAFNSYFPDHSFFLKLKEEKRLKKEAMEKRLMEIQIKKRNEKRLKIAAISLASFIVFFMLFRKTSSILKKRAEKRKAEEEMGMSFQEILMNSPSKELIRENERKLMEKIDENPVLRDVLNPFAMEHKIPFEDILLINLYLEKGAKEGESFGIDKLKGTCADYEKGIVFTRREGEDLILLMKDIY